jgi:hypothetical protein
MSRYVFDIETDDLLQGCTRMWILSMFDLDTRQMHTFLEGDNGWMKPMFEAEELIGHFIHGFDIPALEKLFGWKPRKRTKIIDTVIYSRVLNYRRFGDPQIKEQGHSLEVWGNFLGYPKIGHEDWSQFSPEMQERNLQDVRLNVKIWEDNLLPEYLELKAKEPQIEHYIKAEHSVAKWCAQAELKGWPFDKEAALRLEVALEADMQKAYDALSSQLGRKCVPLDKEAGEVNPKRMTYTKQGTYNATTAKYWGIDPLEGLLEPNERTIEINGKLIPCEFIGDYCRVEFPELSLDSHADVKIFLFRNGWVPTEWNYKKDKDTGRPTKERSSPKITEESLELLGGQGKLYPGFLTARSRHAILKTWIQETDPEGNLHGNCITIGTPSMRATHKTVVNVPSSDSPWGREMRELFRSRPGWTLVGCDSEGNQARGLAHYLGDAGFIDTLLNGDIHTYNANILDTVLKGLGVSWDDSIIKQGKAQIKNKHLVRHFEKTGMTKEEYLRKRLYANRPGATKYAKKFVAAVKRAAAKRILYAFLFGASGAKLWSYIFDTADYEKGKLLKEGFTRAVPGFEKLLKDLAKIFGQTSKYGDGYIPGIAGNRIYVDSFHKLLVYLLQSTEKATCGAACMLLMEWLDAESIPYQPCIMMHDELDFLVPDEHVERAKELGKAAFAEGPKLFGIQIMGGSGKSGQNWYEVH